MLLQVHTCLWASIYRGKCCMHICMQSVTTSVLATLHEAMSNTLLDNGSAKYKTLTQLH